ncbi:MAG: hypothetical protein KGN84_17715, partial [Acidobacteriota bacterium]|nr:hypothetical protein [Acidobacteriota bacterium]
MLIHQSDALKNAAEGGPQGFELWRGGDENKVTHAPIPLLKGDYPVVLAAAIVGGRILAVDTLRRDAAHMDLLLRTAAEAGVVLSNFANERIQNRRPANAGLRLVAVGNQAINDVTGAAVSG